MGSGAAFILAAVLAAASSDSPDAGRPDPSDSLTIRYLAKIYLLPSEDAPLIGIGEDGRRLPVFARKEGWTQVGYRRITGWVRTDPSGQRNIQVVDPAPPSPVPEGPSSPLGSFAAVSGLDLVPAVVPRGWLPFLATGIAALALLAGLLIVRRGFRRTRRPDPRPPAGRTVLLLAPLYHARSAETGEAAVPTEPCSLEGRIASGGLCDILQFLEVGQRTGTLSIEDGPPAGVLQFANGIITFAQTPGAWGIAAVLEMLSLDRGAFRFYGDKRMDQSNCRLSAFEVALRWAHRQDETVKQAQIKVAI